MFVLFIFFLSSFLGTVAKALLMSIVTRSVRCARFGAFRPSCMRCVSVVRSVVVEFLALKPCWVDEFWKPGMILMRISFSRILRGLQKRDIGL